MSLIAKINSQIGSLINYADPMGTLSRVVSSLGLPSSVTETIRPYAYNKANNEIWINGVINLLTTYQTQLKYPIRYNFDFDELMAKVEINPKTGQPWGFSSVDLQTGEIVIDGVVVKKGINPPTLKRNEPTPDPEKGGTNIWPWLAIALGAWWLKKT